MVGSRRLVVMYRKRDRVRKRFIKYYNVHIKSRLPVVAKCCVCVFVVENIDTSIIDHASRSNVL